MFSIRVPSAEDTLGNRSGKRFEDRVAEAYEVLGYQVTRNVQLGGRQTDVLARMQVPGSSPLTLAIECKDHKRPIGNTVVSAFAAVVTTQCNGGLITDGVLVSSSGFTSDARAVADGVRELTLLSGEELASLIFNVRYPLRELVERYEQEEIFKDYLPLKVSVRNWGQSSSSLQNSFDPLLEQMIEFDGNHGVGAMVVLGDFGAGKTTLLRHIEYDRAKAHLDGDDERIPLFVQLRDFRESQDVSALLRSSFRNIYYRDIPIGLLSQRLEKGRFYLLLDGFDEMVDRSDATRRLELFHALTPLLRSASPAILTSRPSYLVEKGELESLLAQIRDAESAVPAPVAGGGERRVAAERLRRKLFEQLREDAPRQRLDPNMRPPEIGVVRLRPLDKPQIEEFVNSYKAPLEAAGASTKDVLDFIDRTYDLTDLATRPMLLRLIVSTVVIEGLDLADTNKQYGASGLYDIYTHAKLDFDVDKVPGRDGGLDVNSRRQIAELLALEMYEAKTLELEFHRTLDRLTRGSRNLRRTLSASRLSDDEIATDLAARSFVTLDRTGTCRFIHKSFRGFFVARRLKETLPSLHPLFEEPLEREVLYFLGGFDPTEASVGKTLWAAYAKTSPAEMDLRRNLLVAYLFTRPTHSKLRISDVEIFDVEFGRLHLGNVSLSDVVLRDTTILKLEAPKGNWSNVHLADVHFVDTWTPRGSFSMSLQDAVLDDWDCEQSSVSLTCINGTIENWRAEGSSVHCKIPGVLRVEDLELDQTEMSWETLDAGEATLLRADMTNGFLSLQGRIAVGQMTAKDSLIFSACDRELEGNWSLRGSILRFGGAAVQSSWSERVDVGLRMDSTSVVLAPKGVSQRFLTLPGGVFGVLSASSGKLPLSVLPRTWGTVAADEVLKEIAFPRDLPGCVIGELILLWADRYAALVDNDLPGISAIDELLQGDPDFSNPEVFKKITRLRSALRKQHKAWLGKGWARFEDHASRSELELMADGEKGAPASPGGSSTAKVAQLIERSPGITASEIAKALKIKPNDLHRILNELEGAGRVRKGGRSYHPTAKDP
jgi:hypothetical protein